MIDAWRVECFKKFSAKKEFPLKSLTILSGVNSSGKSSLLQSILLVKQTIMSASPDRAIALNGPLVQLGSYSDIYNPGPNEDDNQSQGVSFGWSISRAIEDENDVLNEYYYVDATKFEMKVDFKVSNAVRKSSNLSSEMYPTLIETSLSMVLEDDEGDKSNHFLTLTKSKGGGRPLRVNTSLLEGVFDPQEYLVSSIDEETRKDVLGNFPGARLSGGSLRNFLPNGVAVRYDRTKFEQDSIRSMIFDESFPGRRNMSIQISPSALDFIKAHAFNVFKTAEQSAVTQKAAETFDSLNSNSNLFDYNRAIRSVHPSTRKRLIESFRSHREHLEDTFRSESSPDLTLTKRIPSIASIVEAVTSYYFRFNLYYVGPLRDEPKPIYSSRQISSSTDVGPRGEFTAAVLSLNEQTIIEYYFPDAKKEDGLEFDLRKASLPTAVGEWLAYLGVADDVSVSEKGSLGYELKVRTQTDQMHRDLTNVGVGVSQVLPVVITVLLASSGATILLEQPELHLHPRVQSRLCDFFLAASRQGKQIIVETHSEHIIERLRLRVVQDRTNSINRDSAIYFFDNGPDFAKPIEISNYGAVIDWPSGFFDESAAQTTRILDATMKRKISERRKKEEQ